MGQTSIPVDSAVRDRLASDKPDDVSWSEYLTKLHSDGEIPVDVNAQPADVDADDIARRVAERLEGAKPLDEMAFEDWFEPDYAQTIAHHISADLDSELIANGFEANITDQLDSIEASAKTAEERTGAIDRKVENLQR
jgi:hypothetical protein